MIHLPRSLSRTVLATAIAAALSPAIVWAQSADATLRGRAPADTDVTARNVATGFTRRAHTAQDGSYTIAGLPPGTYRVDAGPGTEQTVTLSVATTATLNLGEGAVAEVAPPTTEATQEIVVTGRRLAEVKTSEVANVVSQHQIETVPQMTRNFLEFADTVPGVQFQVDSKGRTLINAGAQNRNGINVYIDGVGQKGYVRSGLSGQTGDTQGNPFPQLAIGEYKVITSNYKAEYDQLSSAAITAITRSGTNEFQGEAFGTYTADNWRARTPAELDTGIKTPSESKEYGVSFGGPIIQDRLHFFLTYEAKRYQTPVTVTLDHSPPPEVVANLPADAVAQLGPASIVFDEDLYFAKLDWEPTDFDRFDFTAKLRREDSQGDQAGTGVAQSATINTSNNEDRYELFWKHNGDGWLNEVQLGYEKAPYLPHLRSTDQNGAVYTFIDNNANDQNILIANGADPRASQNKTQKGWSVADIITFTDVGWFTGNHTIKAGVKYKDLDLIATDSIPGRPVFYFDVSAAGLATVPWKTVFALPLEGFDSTVVTNDRQFGIFAQDDWEVNDHLTLNLGLRWDIEWVDSYLDFVTPQFLLDSLNTEIAPGLTYRESLGLSSDPDTALDINDYISTGDNRDPYKGAIQPRLGFSYDIGADQRHVIFGGAGRAYDRNLYDYLQLEQTKFTLASTELRFNTPDHPCTPSASCIAWDPAFATDPNALPALLNGQAGEVNLINNDIRTPYSDQFTLGMRNRLGDWNTTAAVTRVLSKDGFVFTLGNRYPNGDFWQNRSQPWGNSPPGLAGSLLVGDSGIETRSTQVLLSAEKPYDEESRWSATFSYTYTHARNNRDINEHYALDQVSIKEYPFILSNAAPKHRVVATGSYGAPWGLMLAAKLTWSTPTPHAAISCLNEPAVFENGAPCTAFSYAADSSDGYKALDLQITKDFTVSDLASFYLRFDILNVTNEHNLVDYIDDRGEDGLITGGRLNPIGNITGFPRTVRGSFGIRF
ncbi:MAG TPA: TonB-dependent receptor [Steroidobacteraceae bacterium]|nr:TonB-dependent receptor [Steroidobacteraceae bacterium]